MIDLEPQYLNLVKSILNQWIPNLKVVAFGSRVNGKAKPFSDLDLAIYSNKNIPLDVMVHLRDSFSSSDLPIKVDLVEIIDLDKEFLKLIEKQSETIQP